MLRQGQHRLAVLELAAARGVCDLVPGGLAAEITAAQTARIIEQAEPSQAVGRARRDLAAELLADLRHLDAQLAGVTDQAHANWAR